jgi:hypothetical protein
LGDGGRLGAQLGPQDAAESIAAIRRALETVVMGDFNRFVQRGAHGSLRSLATLPAEFVEHA